MHDVIKPVISRVDNSMLIETPKEEEVRDVVFQLGSLKSPGPDEFTQIFF